MRRVVTVIGWLFIAVGALGVGRGLWDIAGGGSVRELGIMVLSGVVAILGGALVLRGSAWGRWVLAVWMVGHIIISALHDLVQLAVHVVAFGVVFYFLFRPAVGTAAAARQGGADAGDSS